MKKQCLYFFTALVLIGCGDEKKVDNQMTSNQKSKIKNQKGLDTVPSVDKKDTSELERRMIDAGLVDVTTVVTDIHVDLRYSGSNNFMQRDLYGDLERLYIQPDVAEKLKKAQTYLKQQDSTLSLLVFDGVRPLSVQKEMWDAVKMPNWKKTKFLSNPAYGSIHNYGAAVDISLCTITGKELDMGTPFDDTATLAYPTMEGYFLSKGELTKEQVKNRQLLRNVMYKSGFFGIQTEWWHFNSCTRDVAVLKYKRIE